MNKCGACHTDFGSLTLFEDHRKEWRINTNQQLVGRCVTPQEMDLVQDGKQTWHTQGMIDKVRKMQEGRRGASSIPQ